MNKAKLIRFEDKLKMNKYNTNDIFEELIDFLKYNNSNNFRLLDLKEKSKINIDFDAEYIIRTHEEDHSIIIIKKMDELDEKKISEIHMKYWNYNRTPISIFVFSDEIRVYNNFTLDEQAKTILKCRNKKDLEGLFEYEESNILSGMIWKKLYTVLKKTERVDKKLLNSLKNVLENLHKKHSMDYSMAHNFLARCIFIKYLEDRKAITYNIFVKYNVSNFTELLKPENCEKVQEFFCEMKERFSGDLFNIVEVNNFITEEALEEVWIFFRGIDPLSGQISLFPYDFSIIPIELISNIYETFLDLDNKKKEGTFYTPYFLADFVLKYSLDDVIENKKTYNIKVLDPACGSGVFLVESFKRLVSEYKRDNVKLSAVKLKKILEDNIFGVDINKEALKIACFSLYIALLDYMEPKDIVENNFKFPNLIGKNLFPNDFFDTDAVFNGLKFDVIVGNPPWGSVSGKENKTLHEIYFEKNSIPISDKQIAQSFMAHVKEFSNADTIITLIVSSKIFYNHNAHDFRKYFLENFDLNFIIDLSIAKDNIFKSASAPCTIVSYKANNEVEISNNVFPYYSFKPNYFTILLKKIIIEPNEINRIEQKLFLKYDYLWKIMLFGNEFDFSLIRKLKKRKKLREYLINNKLIIGQGFARGNRKDEHLDLLHMPLIGGKDYLYNYYVDIDNMQLLDNAKFERVHDKRIYRGPHLLIKRTVPTETYRCVSSIFSEDAVFPNTIGAIACLEDEDYENLRYLEAIINSKLCTYYHFHTSSAWGTERPEILVGEHKEFPIVYPDKDSDLYKAIIDLDVMIEKKVEYLFSLRHQSQNQIMKDPRIEYKKLEIKDSINVLQEKLDELIYDLYELDETERQTIEYTHEILTSIHRERNSTNLDTTALRFCKSEEFTNYATIIVEHFNNILNEQGLYIKEQIFEESYFTAINFQICQLDNENEKTNYFLGDIESFFKLLGFSSISEVSYDIYVQRKIKGFTANSFYVIKTKERKNWMKMNAIFDINEFTKEIFLTEWSGF